MIHISIDVPGRGESIVEAQVWHVRRQKMHGGTRKVWAIGVMLEEKDEAYERLLQAAGVAPEQTGMPKPEAGRPSLERSSPAESSGVSSPPPVDSATFKRRTPSETAAISNPPSQPSVVSSPPQAAVSPVQDSSRGMPGESPMGAADDEEVRPEDLIEPTIFRIRVKASAGPRTKILTLAAESEEEARELATRDLEARWTILEVRAA